MATPKFFFPVALFCIQLMPAIAAADDLSWCLPGGAKNPNDSSLPQTTKDVIGEVCNQMGLTSCCDQQNGRWSLYCVQKGADWLYKQSSKDLCGRFAWAKGRVSNGQQRYPRDFSLVTLNGDVYGFQDIQGPIAANGDVTSGYGFSLNGSSHLPLAMAATGQVQLMSGTVNGNVNYGSYVPPTNVTFVNGTASKVAPVNFTTLGTDMQTMSDALNGYSAIAATRTNQTVKFAAPSSSYNLDPELNVFSLSADKIAGATSFDFEVPRGSAVIINVTGDPIHFANAGTVGTVPSNGKILWNFPKTTSLTISSTFLPGSFLAPRANASFNYGQLKGTIVVKSASPEWIELHWAPYHGLFASGCLDWDPTWSCSADTYLDDTGYVGFPAPEAGFIQIAGGGYTSENCGRVSPTHRIWYSFQPASVSPETKPVAVLFNGGPGAATSAGLFDFNTAPWTLDPAKVPGTVQIQANPSTWTQFANLLYIDAPGTGFSYPLPAPDGSKPSVGIDLDRDAGVVLDVMIRFLNNHPAIQANPVMLVGESYGGTRAALILDHLLNYDSLVNGGSYLDQTLHDDLVNHFSTIFPGQTSWSKTQITSQFGHQILIEPYVAGSNQYNTQYNQNLPRGVSFTVDRSGCISGTSTNPQDVYQCNRSDWYDTSSTLVSWYMDQLATAAGRLTRLGVLGVALGVDPASISWMFADARRSAYGRSTADVATPEMDHFFGQLDTSNDHYFISLNNDVHTPYSEPTKCTASGSGRNYLDAAIGTTFLNDVASNVKTFITYAKDDMVVDTMAIPMALNYFYPAVLQSAGYDGGPRGGYARQGWIELSYLPS